MRDWLSLGQQNENTIQGTNIFQSDFINDRLNNLVKVVYSIVELNNRNRAVDEGIESFQRHKIKADILSIIYSCTFFKISG